MLLRCYFDDLMFFPIVLYLLLMVRQHFYGESHTLSIKLIIAIFISFSCTVEFIYPLISSKFTMDLLDFIPYFLGTLFFYKFMNKKTISATKTNQTAFIPKFDPQQDGSDSSTHLQSN